MPSPAQTASQRVTSMARTPGPDSAHGRQGRWGGPPFFEGDPPGPDSTLCLPPEPKLTIKGQLCAHCLHRQEACLAWSCGERDKCFQCPGRQSKLPEETWCAGGTVWVTRAG